MSVEDDLCEGDGEKYLIVTQVHDDKDVVNKTYKEHGGSHEEVFDIGRRLYGLFWYLDGASS